LIIYDDLIYLFEECLVWDVKSSIFSAESKM